MSKLTNMFICMMMVFTLLTGCWDLTEINTLGFVIGVAIDEVQMVGKSEASRSEASKKPKGQQRFAITYQIMNPSGFKADRGGKEGGSSQSYYNMTSEGDTMSSIVDNITSRSSKSPMFEHLKVIIISEKVAESELGFANVLDYFLRNIEVRRGVKVMISKGKASKVLELKNTLGKPPAFHIESVTKNNKNTVNMLPATRLGDLHEYLLRKESFVVQRITYDQGEISLTGAGVFEGQKNNMLGFLGTDETVGLNILTNKVRGGIIEFQIEDNLVVYKMERFNRTIHADIQDPEHIQFHINIKTEGTLNEAFERIGFLEEKNLEHLDDEIAKEIKRLTQASIHKIQKLYKKDVIGLGKYLNKKEYQTWEKIKKNWEKGNHVFSDSQIVVEVKVNLRRTGVVNQTETR